MRTAIPWALLFLVLTLLPAKTGGVNALSRAAAMRAFSSGGTFRIDQYRHWTLDWARTPDGHFTSNKAPAPILAGALPFAALDRLFEATAETSPPSLIELWLLSFLTQALPFAVTVVFCARSIQAGGSSKVASLFFVLSALFGNTASFYFGVNGGHGMAALFFLCAFVTWQRAAYMLAGTLLALCAFSEHATAIMIPFLFLATLQRERSTRPLASITLGILPVVIAGAFYHYILFDNPFLPAISYSNPEVIDRIEGRQFLFGTFHSVAALFELTVGTARGLLFTQPWVFVAWIALVRTKRNLPAGTSLFIAGGSLALLLLISNVASWHGGDAPGPRYLAAPYPALALVLAMVWKEIPRLHGWAWLGLTIALALRVIVQPFPFEAPFVSPWLHFSSAIGGGGAPAWGWLMLTILLVAGTMVVAAPWPPEQR